MQLVAVAVKVLSWLSRLLCGRYPLPNSFSINQRDEETIGLNGATAEMTSIFANFVLCIVSYPTILLYAFMKKHSRLELKRLCLKLGFNQCKFLSV